VEPALVFVLVGIKSSLSRGEPLTITEITEGHEDNCAMIPELDAPLYDEIPKGDENVVSADVMREDVGIEPVKDVAAVQKSCELNG